MKATCVAVFLLAALAAGCGSKETATKTPPSTNTTTGANPLTAPVDYVGAVGQAKKHSEKVIDTASLNKTIDLFYAQEDRYPKDLNELVQMKYLPSLPQAPYGMKFDYNAQSGQLKVVKAQP
jgi:hypothetical protein